jgi:cytochrome c-type biogenesis protein CcsB
MDVELFYLTLLLYSAATAGYLAHLVWIKRPVWKVSLAVLIIGFLSHTASIAARHVEAGYTPVTNRFESLMFFSWVLVAVYLAVQLRHTLPVLGALVTPLALALLLLASFRSKEILPLDRILDSRWLPAHVWFAFLGDALMGVSACLAAMYLLQDTILKKKRIGPLYYRLPSLEVLDRLSYRCISIGFPLLTVGILTGAVWLKSLRGGYFDWQDGRQTASLLVWFLYAGVLHGRLIAGWRGRRIAWMNVIGFLVILATFLQLSHFQK